MTDAFDFWLVFAGIAGFGVSVLSYLIFKGRKGRK